MKKYVTDLIEKTPVAGSEVALPSTGTVTLFINSEDDNILSVMNDAGVISRVAPLETDFDIKNLTDSTILKTTWSGKQDSIIVNGVGDFLVIDEQTDNRNWYGMTTGLNGDVYACVPGGRIYKQTGGVGDFLVIPEQTDNRYWREMTTGLNGDVYACVTGGRIYKQTGGVGDFLVIPEQTNTRSWHGMTTGLNGDVYACVTGGGKIYKQTGGVGDFLVIPESTSGSWMTMTTGLNGDIYVGAHNGRIYKQTGGVGDFLVIPEQTDNRYWYGMTTGLNGDVYACANIAGVGDRIYKQTGGVGDFLVIDEQTDNRNWYGMTTGLSGEIYACVYGGRIYKTIETISQIFTDWTLFAKEFVNVNSGTITRDIDGEGTIDTVSDGTRTWTFTYTDGLLTSWSVV
jgi:hypothetical protein